MIHSRYFASLALLAAVSLSASAYDICAVNDDGCMIYYNVVGDGELEITAHTPFRPTVDYTGVVRVPATVDVDGRQYVVAAVGMRAFAFCDEVSQIVLPSTVTAIGANAFDGCYALTDVKASGVLSSDGSTIYSGSVLSAFTPGTEGAYTVLDGTTEIAPSAFAACTFLTDVTLPESLCTIGDNAFYFCNYLSGVTIPASVTSIGHSAFSDCISLQYIDVASENAQYQSESGVLLTDGGRLLVQSPGAMAGNAFIPDGVTKVGEQAFFRSCGITTLKLPESVSEISDAAFIDCPRLETVELSPSLRGIGPMAFAMCQNLHGIYLPVVNPSDITLGDDVFADIDTSCCKLYVPQQSIESYRNASQWSIFSEVLPYDHLLSQTISWNQDVDSLIVGSAIPLVADASSKLKVEFVLSPAAQHRAAIIDDVLHVYEAGDVTVTAYQSGNYAYLPATPVCRTFKAAISAVDDIVASDIRVYGMAASVVIKGADPDMVATVYDISGRLVYSGTDRVIHLSPRTVYVVRIAGHGYKVITR